MFELKELSKVYYSQQKTYYALNDVSLKVESGEIFGIIGKSGAGKSTLVRCLNFLEKPTAGEVLFDDVDLGDLSEAKLREARRKIGMIFQHFNLLKSATVFDNIALPLRFQDSPIREREQRVKELLSWLELDGLSERYPSELSGGQKQRVAIARALATNPKVLLCDEATSALDPETTISILALLKKINRELGITIIIITHEMDVIKQICDRVAVLDAGCVVEMGRVLEVFTAPKSEVSKRLTQASLHLDLPETIQKKLSSKKTQGHPIVRLAFVGESADRPFTSVLHAEFNVATNILNADLETIGEDMVGFMVCELQGAHQNTEKAIAYLKNQNITVESLGYVE